MDRLRVEPLVGIQLGNHQGDRPEQRDQMRSFVPIAGQGAGRHDQPRGDIHEVERLENVPRFIRLPEPVDVVGRGGAQGESRGIGGEVEAGDEQSGQQ